MTPQILNFSDHLHHLSFGLYSHESWIWTCKVITQGFYTSLAHQVPRNHRKQLKNKYSNLYFLKDMMWNERVADLFIITTRGGIWYCPSSFFLYVKFSCLNIHQRGNYRCFNYRLYMKDYVTNAVGKMDELGKGSKGFMFKSVVSLYVAKR